MQQQEEIRDVAADNELSDLAQRDTDALQALLGELDPGDVQFSGVSADEFKRLLQQTDIPEGEFSITAKLGESHDYALTKALSISLRRRGAKIISLGLTAEDYARWLAAQRLEDTAERRYPFASQPPDLGL